ncbi:MAG: transporter [Candidatus Saccharibacteria bacterium]|nr:transporter [Candidatus Saccharibacteria bacterium]
MTESAARKNRLIINLLLISAFVVILNETVMSVAIPHLMQDLGITALAAQWLTTAFLLTMAVVIPTTGFLIQRISTRRLYMIAMGLFVTGTAIAAIAPGFEVLLIARIVQASGTAIMLPLLMTTVMNLEPHETLGRRMGNISIVIAVAPALGPTISGLILSNLNWRFLFVFVLPIAITMLIIGAKRLRNVGENNRVPIDIISVILSAFGFGGIVFGLSSLGETSAGGDLALFLVPLIIGGLALATFIRRQIILQPTDRALLNLQTFRTPTFTASVIMFVVSMMGMFGVFILLPLYLQNVLGLSVLNSGLLFLPGSLLMGLLAPFVGRLYDKVGPRPLLLLGTTVTTISLWALAFLLQENTSWVIFLVGHIVFSIGLAFIFTPLFTSSLGSLPKHLYSHGSATVSTVQQVAGAAGTALFVSIMSGVAATAISKGASQAEGFAAGIHTALLLGAAIVSLSIVTAFFIKKAKQSAGAPAGH